MELVSYLINWARLTDPSFWVEVWVHSVFVASALTFVLAPFEEWAHENLSTDSFNKIHSTIELFRKYGALNKRPFLPRTNGDVPQPKEEKND